MMLLFISLLLTNLIYNNLNIQIGHVHVICINTCIYIPKFIVLSLFYRSFDITKIINNINLSSLIYLVIMFILRIVLFESVNFDFEYMWMLTLPVVLNMGFTPINGHTPVSTSISGETPLIESAPAPTEYNNITLFIKSLYKHIPEYTIHNTHYVDFSNLLSEPRYARVKEKILYISDLHKGRNIGVSHLKSSILNERPLYAFVASGSYIKPTKSPRILFHYETIQFKPI